MASTSHHEETRDSEDGDCDQVQAVIERYERLLDTRARLQREAEGEFVWVTNRER